MKRPLLILTLAFVAGIAAGVYISFPAGPLLIAAALVFAMLFGLWRVENLREHGRDAPGWLIAGGLLLLVFLAGMTYVTVRQSAARGTVASLVSGENFQGQEAIIEGTIIREPDVREGRAAYIVRVKTINGSPATGLVLVVDYRKHDPPLGLSDHQEAPYVGLVDHKDVQSPEDLQKDFRLAGVYHILPTSYTRKP